MKCDHPGATCLMGMNYYVCNERNCPNYATHARAVPAIPQPRTGSRGVLLYRYNASRDIRDEFYRRIVKEPQYATDYQWGLGTLNISGYPFRTDILVDGVLGPASEPIDGVCYLDIIKLHQLSICRADWDQATGTWCLIP